MYSNENLTGYLSLSIKKIGFLTQLRRIEYWVINIIGIHQITTDSHLSFLFYKIHNN